jgi:predicted DNA-binding transcriptional regulator AlpA
MRRETAAAYCDMAIAEFEREVASGRLPPPIALGRAERWSKSQLDKSLTTLAGDVGEEDWRAGSPLYARGETCRT